MSAQLARRAVSDVQWVCRGACPSTATRWLAALAAHLPECARSRSLRPTDRAWTRGGARFRTSTGAVVSLPAAHTPGAREMYCRNVYLRTGLRMPTKGWVVDLGANHGLFSIWAAVTGASALAVEAQQGFAPLIRTLAEHNGVADRVHIKIAMASGGRSSDRMIGDLADDRQWAATSHGAATRPASLPCQI